MGRRVVDRARIVAESSGSTLEVVHVLESLTEAMLPESLARLVDEHRRREAAEAVSWLRGRTDLPVAFDLLRGSPSWELVRRSKNADLTVVGSSSVDAGRAGPVATAVARMAFGDALIVRRQPRVPYRRIV
ncbi:MAG TPA: universal stress protein, partial [Longimicrobiales bacterium]|nr:universal stress protein [Longimicrobiales bacterium]